MVRGEAPKGGAPGSDGQGQLDGHEGFAELGLAPENAHPGGKPELLDHPGLLGGLLDLGNVPDGERLG